MFLIPQRRTYQELQECLYKNHPDIEILEGEYINYNSRFKLIHKECNHIWRTSAASIFSGSGCPKCGNAIHKTNDEFLFELKSINPNILPISEYKNNKTNVRCRCLIDNYEWDTKPLNLLRNHGCPLCDNKVVVKGINDFNTCHPELQMYLLNLDDGYNFTSCSHKKIMCKCPDCGYEKPVIIKNLVYQGFTCDRCTDGISYPNKFIRELLRQLKGNDYISEFHPIWSNNYRYDCYFIENNQQYIVEMDGAFHYIDKKWATVPLKTQQEIDLIKDKLATQHNITMIRIDSRKSNQNFLKEQITQSKLSTIFNLDNIDWDLCNKKALSNTIKEVALYYENNKYSMSDYDMAKYFGIYIQTFRNYIKEGLKYGWCSKTKYDDMMIKAKFHNHPKSKPVQVFRNELLIGEYPSVNNCANDLSVKYKDKLYGSKIIKCIEGNREYHGFFFKYI